MKKPILSIILFLVAAWTASACSTPVYQYALERWPPDWYRSTVFHRGDLSETNTLLLDLLKKAADDEKSPANIATRTIDVAEEMKKDVSDLYDSVTNQPLPLIVLQYPMSVQNNIPIWTGMLSKENIDKLLDSPTRQKIVSSLSDKNAGAWILVTCGNKKEDDAARKTIKKYLVMENEEETDPADDETGGDSFKFDFIEFSRSDEAEQALLAMMMNSEPDLHKYSNKAMAFLAFGRSRILYALVGEGINEDNILKGLYFVSGPCACQVKAMNPGTDLLMTANWDQIVMDQEFPEEEDQELPELTGIAPDTRGQTPDDRGQTTENGGEQTGKPLKMVVISIFAVMAAIVILGSIIAGRKNTEN